MVREFISEHMSSAPWSPETIVDEFRERVIQCSQAAGPNIPEFTLKLRDGTGLWKFTQGESVVAIPNTEICNGEDGGERAANYRRLLKAWMEQWAC